MHKFFVISGCLLAALAAAPACAAVKIKTTSKSYAISGKEGSELLKAMDRKGPRHGFMTRAIAQTSYSIGWEMRWEKKNGACRLDGAEATLSISYTYPQISNSVSSALKGKWARFMNGVRKHEETHGRLAKQMVAAADRAITGLTMKDDANCRKAQAAVKQRVNAVYAEYEARQVRFDEIEHRTGGNVDGLVRLLKR